MEDSTANSKKPLRPSSNKIKDLVDTYLKNDSGKNIPIKDLELDDNHHNTQKNEKNVEEIAETTNDFDLKDYQKMLDDYKEAVDVLNKQLEDISKEKDEIKEQLVRKAAELENIRRRSLKEKQDMIDYANERLLFKMLDTLDDINNAYNASISSNDFEALKKGVELMKNKAIKLFDEAGVKQIESYVGKEFDVNFHEALMKMPSDLPENFVVQEIQNGYMLNEKVLRHTKVITSAGS